MTDWVTNVTDAAVLDADEVIKYSQILILAAEPELVVDGAVTLYDSGPFKTFTFAKYASLTQVTSALSDGVEVTYQAMADSTGTVTPGEFGTAVCLAKIADLQSGNKAGVAAARLVGRNAGSSIDKIGMAILEAFTTTIIYPGDCSAASNLNANANLDGLFANRLYNKLARANVPRINGSYIGIAHDDCLHDLRQDTSTGGWTDVSKYADPQSVLMNEVGMYGGIRWLRSANVTVTDASWGTTGDSYKVNVVGENALAKAESLPLQLKITGPFDALGRFLNFGWLWVGNYAVIDTSNMIQGIVASSVGANSA